MTAGLTFGAITFTLQQRLTNSLQGMLRYIQLSNDFGALAARINTKPFAGFY